MANRSRRLKRYAREMRRNPTRAEDRVWAWLRSRRFDGVKFRRQVPIGRYIVDFYSATVYYSLGIPTDLFTPIFAIARCSGWCAQVLEQLEDNRLYRPLSEYVGEPVGKKVVPIDERP